MVNRLWIIFVLLPMRNITRVMAAPAEIYPQEIIIIQYNKSAEVSCTASNVAAITFEVAGLNTSMWASRGIIQSAPTYSGSNITTNLTVLGIEANNGLQITCRVIVGPIYVDTSPPVVVMIVEDPTTATSSSSQVSPTSTPSPTTTPSLTTTPSPTTITPTTTTSTPVPSPMMSTSVLGIEVGVVVGVMIAVALVVLAVLGVVASKYIIYKRSKYRPSASKINTNGTSGAECSESTYDNSLQIISHRTTLKHSSTPLSSAVHRDDVSTSVPTSEGHDDVMTSPHPLFTEAAPSQETTTAQCRHEPPTSPIQSTTCQHGPPSASPLHTCIPVAPEDGEVPAGGGVVSITMEMEHGDTSSGDFATSPLSDTHTHMPSCDGVVVGMLTSSPQEEGCESKPSSDTNTGANVESDSFINNNSHQTTLQHSSTPPSSAVHRDDGSSSLPTSEGPSAALPFQTQLAAPPKDGGGGMVCITIEMEHVDTSQHDQKGD